MIYSGEQRLQCFPPASDPAMRPSLSPVQTVPRGFLQSAGSAKALVYFRLKQGFRVRGAVIPLIRTISLRADYETHDSHSPLHIHTLTYYTRTNKETNEAIVPQFKSLS